MSRSTKIGLSIVALGAFLYIFGMGKSGFIRLYNLTIEESSLAERERQLKREIVDLHSEVRYLECDTLYIEKIAREQYNLSHPDEIVYRFPDVAESSAPASSR